MTSLPVLMAFLVAGVWQCNGVSLMRVKEVDVRIFENGDFDLGGDKYNECIKNEIKDNCKIEIFKSINNNIKGYLNIKFKKEINKMEIKFKLNDKKIYENEINVIDDISHNIKKIIEFKVPKKNFINEIKDEKVIDDLNIKINKINMIENKFCIESEIKIENLKNKIIKNFKFPPKENYKCFKY